ncbi:MAG TPA: HAD family phosphatase [Thermoanaerobaculia bacterium]|nr:HAD family phosphatase [Thermoanaerobaculia bacterium]
MIFDFDETIIDLEPQHTAAYEALCRAHGSDYQAMPEWFRTSSGRRVIDEVREMKAHFGWPEPVEELFAQRQHLFDAVCASAELVPMPGAMALIGALRKSGIPLAITSSAVRASIEAILTRLGVRDAFAIIVDGSEVTHGKPDPEAYLVTAQRLGVEPRACVVLEDSEVGVLAAKRAGMFCIAVRNPRARTTQDLSPADVVVGSMEEIELSW